MAFQFRRGTDAERQSITPRLGEPLYVTDTGKVFVGDGTTQGGVLLSGKVSADDSPALSGNLDLGGNDIVGSGNIDIDGYINASGNINLGDGAEDNIIVGGVIESPLVPGEGGQYDLGDGLARWRNGFFEGVDVDGEIRANTIAVDNIYAPDSSPIYDSVTDRFFGDINGGVFANNGDIIVDSIDKNITAGDIVAQSTDQSIGSFLSLRLTSETEDLSSDPTLPYGSLDFGRDDVNGIETAAFVRGGPNYITMGVGTTFADANSTDKRIILFNGDLGIGILPPTEKLDVAGNIKARGNGEFFGDVTAAGFKGSLSADDSTIIVDSIENSVTTNTVLTDILNLAVLNTEPTLLENGTVAIADGSGWDPTSTGVQTMVVYLDGVWRQIASA